jgi:hypothetical protein
MTSRQLKRFLKKSGLSQRGSASLVGIDERTMRRYVAGKLPVPRAVELALRWIAANPD